MTSIIHLQRNVPHFDEETSDRENKKDPNNEDLTHIPRKNDDKTPHIPENPTNKK